MKNYNSANERIKRKYSDFLRNAKGHSEPTIGTVEKALKRFEVYNRFKDFKKFHIQQANNFKKNLADQKGQQSGEKLSKSTLYSTLSQLKRFFQWLSQQPGYKSRIQYYDAEYFNLSAKETRIATAKRPQKVPTMEQIKRVINTMPASTEIECRNRALIAFTLMTGARISAIASMNLKHVDLDGGYVFQDAREVQTKFSKTFTTYFLPVGNEIHDIFADWVLSLLDKMWGNDDPLFPATRIEQGPSHQFEAVGLAKKHWRTTTPIRNIFREAFVNAGIPYFNPHSFRKTLVQLGYKVCVTHEDLKAWSQNIGHEDILTTIRDYGDVTCQRQGEIIRNFAIPKKTIQSGTNEIVEELFKKLQPHLKG